MVIAGAYYPNYFLQGEIDEDLASRDLSGFNPRTTVMVGTIDYTINQLHFEVNNALHKDMVTILGQS